MAIQNGYEIKGMKVSVADAKNKLPELIKAVEGGESVTICRRGAPVVDIVRTQEPGRKKSKFGTLKCKIQILDPDWWKPMTDEEVEAFLEGARLRCGCFWIPQFSFWRSNLQSG
jgi:antitoxin (DNA-binding transcriptional repressor) of toxin-antitoxin stability system